MSSNQIIGSKKVKHNCGNKNKDGEWNCSLVLITRCFIRNINDTQNTNQLMMF